MCLVDRSRAQNDRGVMRPDSSIHWSAYPSLLPAGAFAAGVLVNTIIQGGAVLVWVGGAVVAVAGFGGMHWLDRRRMVSLAPLGQIGSILLLVLCAGAGRHAVYNSSSPRSVKRVVDSTDQVLRVSGIVESPPNRGEDRTQFTLAADTISTDIRTTWASGQVRVTLHPSPWSEPVEPFPSVRQGDRLRLRGTIQRPPTQRNPGGFDYRAYLARRGTCCTMYVGDPTDVVQVETDRGLLTPLVAETRHQIRQSIRHYVPSADGQAVLQALLLGDRSRISNEQREHFSQTGLTHLLAVSGLHVFLVGMVLYILLRPVLMRFRLGWRTVEAGRAALTVLVLGLYMALTGARPSVVRAVVMATLFIGGILFQRSTHPLNTLGVAALILLAVRPPAMFDAGFQLSMTAVVGIVVLHPRFYEWVPKPWRSSAAKDWLSSMVCASAAAIVGTAPVLLYHFGWVSVAGVVLNIFGIPCTGLALAAAIAMVVGGTVSATLGAVFGATADLFVRGLLLTSEWGATWFSRAGIRMAEVDFWTLGALVAGVICVAQWPRPRIRWRLVVCVLLLAGTSVWLNAASRDARPTLDLVFFDVGQGDAALLATPRGRHILVDTGPYMPGGTSPVSHSVLPYLQRRGIEHLDAVIVTHPDADHLGGLPSILREVSVGRVVHSGQSVDTDLYEQTRVLLKEREVSSEPVERGDTLRVDSTLRVQILNPPRDDERRGIESENDRSVVLFAAYGETHILLPGDVEADAERDLARSYQNQLDSDIVKVPHHGSKTSSTTAFVEKTAGTSTDLWSVISAGRSNSFGMPHEEVVSRWRAHGARVVRTDTGGSVWLRSDGRSVWEVRWR